jgi:hypothetical protein
MKWLFAALAEVFSGLAQGFLSIFGMSDAQKLGRAQVTVDQDAKALQEVRKANEIENLNARISDDALRLRLGKFKRPD